MPGPPKLALCKTAKGEPVPEVSVPALVCPSLVFLDRDGAMGPPTEGPRTGKATESRFI